MQRPARSHACIHAARQRHQVTTHTPVSAHLHGQGGKGGEGGASGLQADKSLLPFTAGADQASPRPQTGARPRGQHTSDYTPRRCRCIRTCMSARLCRGSQPLPLLCQRHGGGARYTFTLWRCRAPRRTRHIACIQPSLQHACTHVDYPRPQVRMGTHTWKGVGGWVVRDLGHTLILTHPVPSVLRQDLKRSS